MQQIKILLKNGYNEFSYRIISKNGVVKYLKTNAWYQDIENQTYVMTCFQKDVTLQMETGNRLKKSLQRHHHISDIAITLNSTDNFEYKLQLVIDKIGSSLQPNQVSLYEIDNEQMVCRYIWTKHDPVIPQGVVEKIPPLQQLPDYINTLQYSEGENLDGFMRCWKRPEHVQSLLLIPIRIRQKMFGFIEIVSIKKRKWKDDDFSFLSTVGNITANFYDRKTINDELNLNYLYQELLANVSYKLNQYIDDNEQALKKVLGYIGLKNQSIERVYIYKYDEENNLFRKSYDYSNPSLHPKYLSYEEVDASLLTDALVTLKKGKPCCINNISELSRELHDFFNPLLIQSILISPLFVNNQFYGVFGYAVYSYSHHWNKSEKEMAQSFARSISHYIERQAIMRELKNSEKKFKDISAKFPGCIFQATLSPTEDITLDYISPHCEQWTGMKTFSKTSLKKIQQTIHPNDLDAFLKVRKDLEGLHPELSFE
jgi:GAF domain-containing protein